MNEKISCCHVRVNEKIIFAGLKKCTIRFEEKIIILVIN